VLTTLKSIDHGWHRVLQAGGLVLMLPGKLNQRFKSPGPDASGVSAGELGPPVVEWRVQPTAFTKSGADCQFRCITTRQSRRPTIVKSVCARPR
jgi:hypothetical protein